MNTKVWLNGYNGRMGKEIAEEAKLISKLSIVGGSGHNFLKNLLQEKESYTSEDLLRSIKDVDLIIDFSNVTGNQSLLEVAGSLNSKSFLIGTTGLQREARDQWKAIAKENGHKILFAPNTSLGVLLTMKTCQQIAKVLSPKGFDIEIIESHHRNKVDSPSGTAMLLADRICDVVPLKPVTARDSKREKNEIGVFALRGGSVFGEHEVKFMGDSEELSVSHRALSRTLFAKGALLLGEWIHKQKKSGHYGLTDISLEDIAFH